MFRKKKGAKQDQSIPEDAEESKLTNDSESGFRKEAKMANLTSDAEIKGTIKFGQAMRIDGNFEGKLISDNGELVVGKTGNIKANIKIRSVVVEGRVDGNIKASDRVELKQNAHLIGNLQAKTLVMEKGGVFVGKCNIKPKRVKTESHSYKKVINGKTKEERVEEIIFNRFINV